MPFFSEIPIAVKLNLLETIVVLWHDDSSWPSVRVAPCPPIGWYASFNRAQVPAKHRFRRIACKNSARRSSKWLVMPN